MHHGDEQCRGKRSSEPVNLTQSTLNPSTQASSSAQQTANAPLGTTATAAAAGVTTVVSSGGAVGGSMMTTASHSSAVSGAQFVPSYETTESVLPREFRTRLHKLFLQIERDFEREYRKLYTENISLQERLEKYEDGEHPETNFLAKKLGASQISQKIKLQYKQSTSRLVSSLRPTQSSGGWQLGCRMSGHRDGVWEVTAHRKLVGSASADGTVRLWANTTGNCLLMYGGHTGSVNSVRFHDDLMLTASGDGSVHLVRLAHEVLSLGTATAGSSAQTGSTCTGGTTSTVGTTPLSTSASGGSVGQANNGAQGEDDQGNNGEFDEDSVTLLRHPMAVYEVGTPSGTGGHVMESAAVAAADFLSGGEQVVTGSWDRQGRIYDLASGALVQCLSGHENELTDVRCAPGGQRLALTSAKDATFRLWDFRSSAAEVHIQQAHSQIVSTARFLGDHPEKLVSAGTDRVCKVWDLRQSRAPLLTIRTDAAINRLAVHPGGQILALPLDNRNVKFFDLTGQRLGRLPRSNSQGHSRMVTSVCWADEGKNNFFSGAFDHQVLGWQIQFPLTN